MTYARKLLIAKICVSVAMAFFTLLPLLSDINANIWNNILALPIMIYAVWGKLHGTGRSVRLIAFLGMAYCIGTLILASKLGYNIDNTGKYSLYAIFALFVVGIGASLKPRSTPN